ncbi:hypothetical protein PGTUg99_018493 [Puccinia graminis f. sp. tritici]|uniref:Uncharacterized protein n=1 Tax=Puccinia graminis f. sp. tritici TaxID=56615 RepID=A0A5B0SJY9_PUCGR|nr:hypothetical protein PGTUg99_018493 [Puccinia graminis f. sp. tritici]
MRLNHHFHPVTILVVFHSMVAEYSANLDATIVIYAKCPNQNKPIAADQVVKCTSGQLTCSGQGTGKPGVIKCSDKSGVPQLQSNPACPLQRLPECEVAMQKGGQLSKVL